MLVGEAMITVILLLGLKWAGIAFMHAGGQADVLGFVPIAGLSGSGFMPVMVAGAAIDILILWFLIRKKRGAVSAWIVLSFLATTVAGFLDIGLQGLLMERSDSGNALRDSASDTFRSYAVMGPGVLGEMLLGTVYLVIDAVWHIILLVAALRWTSR